MATPKTATGEQIKVKIGDGGSPEAFTHPCLINAERGIEFSSDVTQTTIPDCAATDSPGWKATDVDGLSATISGAGIFDLSYQSTMHAWYVSGLGKNIRFQDDATGANGGGYYAGSFKLTQWNKTGARKGKCMGNMTLVSDGPVTFTANA